MNYAVQRLCDHHVWWNSQVWVSVWVSTGTIAQAVQPAIHDVTDGSVLRSWLNSPLSSGLEQDVYKATNILHSFAQVGSLQPEKGIPAAVLQGAAGFAILSVVKVTAVFCYGCMQCCDAWRCWICSTVTR